MGKKNVEPFIYNPNDWEESCLAFFAKKEGNSIKVDTSSHTSAHATLLGKLQSEVEKAGEAPSEAMQILLNEGVYASYFPLTEAIQLTEFDPSTEGGYKFWDTLFSCTSLKDKAKKEGTAFGEWDLLRQAMNMGTIAYMAKVNVINKFINNLGDPEVIKTLFGNTYHRYALTYKASKEEMHD